MTTIPLHIPSFTLTPLVEILRFAQHDNRGLEGRYGVGHGVGCRSTAGIVLSCGCRLNDWDPVWDEDLTEKG